MYTNTQKWTNSENWRWDELMWAVPAYPANLHSMECKTAITGNWKKVQECNQLNGEEDACRRPTKLNGTQLRQLIVAGYFSWKQGFSYRGDVETGVEHIKEKAFQMESRFTFKMVPHWYLCTRHEHYPYWNYQTLQFQDIKMIFSGTNRLIMWKAIKYTPSCFPYMALEVIQEKTWHKIFVWILTLSWNSGIALLTMVVLHLKTVESSGSPFMVPGHSCWYYWAPIKVPRYSWHKRRRVSEVLPFKLRSGLEYQNSTQNTSSKMPWVSIAHCAEDNIKDNSAGLVYRKNRNYWSQLFGFSTNTWILPLPTFRQSWVTFPRPPTVCVTSCL